MMRCGFAVAVAVVAIGVISGCGDPPQPRAEAPVSDPVATGRYLVLISGCHDCHTPDYMQRGRAVSEDLWLTGVAVGWRGPWGTTYASNLRRFVQPLDEEGFVQMMRDRQTRPPMPWESLHAMTDRDLRAVFRYIKSLPVAGSTTPAYVPPGQEPSTPYLSMEPAMPAAASRSAPASAPANAASGAAPVHPH